MRMASTRRLSCIGGNASRSAHDGATCFREPARKLVREAFALGRAVINDHGGFLAHLRHQPFR